MRPSKKIQSLLVVGVDCSALAKSTYRAGYTVFGADYFGDIDLRSVCKESLSIQKQEAGKSCGILGTGFSPDAILALVEKLQEAHELDGCLLASGMEDSHDILAKLHRKTPIIGNNPAIISKVRNRIEFFKELRRLGLTYPETEFVQSVEDAKRVAKDLRYPIVVKPPTGFGGSGIRKLTDKRGLRGTSERIIRDYGGVLIQEFISGLPASISFIASQESTEVLTINEQLYGLSEAGQKEEFGYCGNVVPADLGLSYGHVKSVCEDIVGKIGSRFHLTGSNGVDVVLSEDLEPYVLEVNPRFQGTLECVERVLGINLVEAHLKACIQKTLPSFQRSVIEKFCTRLILYAHHRSSAPALQRPFVADTPLPGVVIEAGEPLCSVISQERTRAEVLQRSKSLASQVYDLLDPA